MRDVRGVMDARSVRGTRGARGAWLIQRSIVFENMVEGLF